MKIADCCGRSLMRVPMLIDCAQEKVSYFSKNYCVHQLPCSILLTLFKSINLFKWPHLFYDSTALSSALDRIGQIILKHELHVFSIFVKQTYCHVESFSFRFVTFKEVKARTKGLEKNGYPGDITLKLFKKCYFT